MIKVVLIALLVIVIVCLCKKNKKNKMKTRTPKSQFNSTVSYSSDQSQEKIQPDQVLIVYAPWCGHCKKSMNDFKQAVEKSDKIRLINSDESPDIVRKYNIRGYPTILKSTGQIYTGDRSANSILDFANS
jgi:thiol-disulfide isomerase/thioredoxin